MLSSQLAKHSHRSLLIGSGVWPSPERPLEFRTGVEVGDHLDRARNAPVEVIECEHYVRIKSLDRELAGLGVPAGAVATIPVAPVVA